MGLGLSLLSYNHFIEEPTAASTFAIMSNPHPTDLPEGYCLNYKLIQLVIKQTTKQTVNNNTFWCLLKLYVKQRNVWQISWHIFLNQQHCGYCIFLIYYCYKKHTMTNALQYFYQSSRVQTYKTCLIKWRWNREWAVFGRSSCLITEVISMISPKHIPKICHHWHHHQKW